MSRSLTLAAIQFTPSDDMQENIDRVSAYIRDAAGQGADVVLPPELFCGYYFCKTQEEHHFARALPWTEHPAVAQHIAGKDLRHQSATGLFLSFQAISFAHLHERIVLQFNFDFLPPGALSVTDLSPVHA